MHKLPKHDLRVFRFDENPPKLPLSSNEVKVSSWILSVLGPGSPKDPTSYEKERSFSPQDLHGFWGGG